jgi:hypothetical protein
MVQIIENHGGDINRPIELCCEESVRTTVTYSHYSNHKPRWWCRDCWWFHWEVWVCNNSTCSNDQINIDKHQFDCQAVGRMMEINCVWGDASMLVHTNSSNSWTSENSEVKLIRYGRAHDNNFKCKDRISCCLIEVWCCITRSETTT